MENETKRELFRIQCVLFIRALGGGLIAGLVGFAMQLPGRAWLARVCFGEPCLCIADLAAGVAAGLRAQRQIAMLFAKTSDPFGLAAIARQTRPRSRLAAPALLAVSRQLIPMEAEQCAEFVVRYPDVIRRLLGAHDSSVVAAAARALSLGGSPAELARARRQLGRRAAGGQERDVPDLATAISGADAILAEAAAAAQLAHQSVRAVTVTSAGHDTEMLRPGGVDLGGSDDLVRASAPTAQLPQPPVNVGSSIGP